MPAQRGGTIGSLVHRCHRKRGEADPEGNSDRSTIIYMDNLKNCHIAFGRTSSTTLFSRDDATYIMSICKRQVSALEFGQEKPMNRTTSCLRRAVLLAVAVQLWPLASANASCSENGYIGSICYMAGNFCPQNHVLANGTEYPISKYEALYSIIGNTYNTPKTPQYSFRVPNLIGHAVVGAGEFKPMAGVDRSMVHMHGQKSDESDFQLKVPLGAGSPEQGSGNPRNLAARDLPADVRVEARKVPTIAMTACIVAMGLYPPRD